MSTNGIENTDYMFALNQVYYARRQALDDQYDGYTSEEDEKWFKFIRKYDPPFRVFRQKDERADYPNRKGILPEDEISDDYDQQVIESHDRATNADSLYSPLKERIDSMDTNGTVVEKPREILDINVHQTFLEDDSEKTVLNMKLYEEDSIEIYEDNETEIPEDNRRETHEKSEMGNHRDNEMEVDDEMDCINYRKDSPLELTEGEQVQISKPNEPEFLQDPQFPLCWKCKHIRWPMLAATKLPMTRKGLMDYHNPYEPDTACPFCLFLGVLKYNRFDYIHVEAINVARKYAPTTRGNPSSMEGDYPIISFHLDKHREPPTWLRMLQADGTDHNTIFRTLDPSAIDISVIKDWLSVCARDHTDFCLSGAQIKLPGFRVIDCETRRVILAPPKCNYVALSYVWGDNREEPKIGYPATIEDSITVTLAIGYRYLWVDRYVCHTPSIRCEPNANSYSVLIKWKLPRNIFKSTIWT